MKVKNKFYFIIFFIFYLFNYILPQEDLSKEIKLNFNQNTFTIVQGFEPEYSMIDFTSNNYFLKEDIANPELPYKSVNLLVERNAKFIDLNYSYSTILFAENIILQPGQPFFPTSMSNLVCNLVSANDSVYSSNDPFPKSTVEYIDKQSMSNYTYFTFLVSPFIYYPKEKKLYIIEEINIIVHYGIEPTFSEFRRDNGIFDNLISQIVINKEDINSLNAQITESAECEYLIITSENLKEYFQPLAEWKIKKGITTEIKSVEDIYLNYSGESEQLMIKNCIYDYYKNRGTMWILLGGDNTVVPVFLAYCFQGIYTDTLKPCDLYYTCFDKQFDWNADGDIRYGEPEDNIDISHEVIIGRAPVRTASHVTAFVNKTLNYEVSPTTSNFIEEFLLCGVRLFGIYDGRSDSELKCEKMRTEYIHPNWSGNTYGFYDTNTDFGGPSYEVSKVNFAYQMNLGYHFLYFSGHGASYGVPLEVSDFVNSDAANLMNLHEQGVILTNSCHTNNFNATSDPCYSEAYLRNSNGGAVAYWGSSSYGWDLFRGDHGPSTLLVDYFLLGLFNGLPNTNQRNIGILTSIAKNNFIPLANQSIYRSLIFAQNLVGDPELNLFTYNPIQIIAEHSMTIPHNSSNLSIKNSNCMNGIAALSSDGVVLGKAIVENGNGIITFNPINEIGRDITLTITGHNYIPYITQLTTTSEFTSINKNEFPSVNSGSCEFADINSDGDLDLIIIGDSCGFTKTKLFINYSDFEFIETGLIFLVGNNNKNDETLSDTFIGVSAGDLDFGDYDNDGDSDLLLTGYNDELGYVSVVYENSINSFILRDDIELRGVYLSYCSWIDFDNDGDLDIFIFGKDSDSKVISRIYENIGNNQFSERQEIDIVDLYSGAADWGDFDNDGDLDLIIMGLNDEDAPYAAIYVNNGLGVFNNSGIPIPKLYNGSVSWCDYNNDGYLDFIISGLDENNEIITQFFKNVNNSFETDNDSQILPVYNSSLSFGDYDNDGDSDLLLHGFNKQWKNKLYKNGNGKFEETETSFAQYIDGFIQFIDLDADGDLDIFSGGFKYPSLKESSGPIYSNNTSNINTKPTAPNELFYKTLKDRTTLSWSRGLDFETEGKGLSYNIYLRRDNHQFITNIKDTLKTFYELQPGKYYWSVQTVDTGYEYSDFAEEQIFLISEKIYLNLKIYLEGAYR
ncbi:MAG: VCBS repeat-containing protein [Ignavibacteriales bacterium]|nr:VCBS repeat-containing protein [Ignavibacteriales bacterium]